MIDKIHTNSIEVLKTIFKKYTDQELHTMLNVNSNIIGSYIKTLDVRKYNINLLNSDIIEKAKKHTILLYQYSPMRTPENVPHNKNIRLYDSTKFRENQITSITKNHDVITTAERGSQIEEINIDLDPLKNSEDSIQVRDMMFGKFDYECVMISADIDLLNNFQFVYYQQLKNKKPEFQISLDIPELDEPTIIKDLSMEFSDINEIGHIDYENYGNIFKLSFSFSIEVPVISGYTYAQDVLRGIDVKFFIQNKEQMQNL